MDVPLLTMSIVSKISPIPSVPGFVQIAHKGSSSFTKTSSGLRFLYGLSVNRIRVKNFWLLAPDPGARLSWSHVFDIFVESGWSLNQEIFKNFEPCMEIQILTVIPTSRYRFRLGIIVGGHLRWFTPQKFRQCSKTWTMVLVSLWSVFSALTNTIG